MSQKEYGRIASIQFEIIKYQLEYVKENKKQLSHLLASNNNNNNSNSSNNNDSIHKFNILERRNSNKKKPLIDSFEQILLQTLDSNNQLIGNYRLSIFLILMHRVEKLEQRLLCIHILRYHTPRESHENLVQSGIFRVLNKWIQFYLSQDFDSEDSSGIPILILICHLLRECYYLDINIAKKYDILRLIKRMAKVSSAVNSTDELQQAVNDLKTSWQEEVNKQDSVVRAELLKSIKPIPEKSTPKAVSSEEINQTNDNNNNNNNNSNSSQQGDSTTLNTNSKPSNKSIQPSSSVSPQQQPQPTPNILPTNSQTSSSISTSPRSDTKVTVVPARTSHQPLNVFGKLGVNQVKKLLFF